ncbi:MAG: ABC transporter ATP-binding protein, partial [Candidatus Latescibacterota bacterium]|nr:ABC transporter ATP-binding protein [Candidatus Latescibacterota bacterium]
VLEVRHLTTEFVLPNGNGKAVDDLSFKVLKGETLGIVGESGCGKSMTALSILNLIPRPPGIISSGEILFENKDLLTLNDQQMREVRGRDISMIFQEPMTSLNPVLTIGYQIEEVLSKHLGFSKAQAKDKTVELLNLVRIPESEKRASQYPHQLSGGMRQRAMIAMALCCEPKILIADEPTTALDVTIQAQVLDLI